MYKKEPKWVCFSIPPHELVFFKQTRISLKSTQLEQIHPTSQRVSRDVSKLKTFVEEKQANTLQKPK